MAPVASRSSTSRPTPSSSSPSESDLATVQLSLISQGSLDADRFTLDGQPKIVHYVIKNQSYTYELALSSSSPACQVLDFSRFYLEADLIYDNSERKEITSLRVKPVAFRASLNPTDPQRIKVDATIAILSSHHEDLNFLLNFFLVDSQTKKRLPNASTVSESICVISKPEVLDKKKNPKKRKRTTANDTILELLQKIQQEQQAQRSVIDELRTTVSTTSTSSINETPSANHHRRRLTAVRPTSSSTSTPSFEQAFQTLLYAYIDTPADERSSKIRKVVHQIQDQTNDSDEYYNNNNNNDNNQVVQNTAQNLVTDLYQAICFSSTSSDTTSSSSTRGTITSSNNNNIGTVHDLVAHADDWLGHALACSESTSFDDLIADDDVEEEDNTFSPLLSVPDSPSSSSSSCTSSPSVLDDQSFLSHQVGLDYITNSTFSSSNSILCSSSSSSFAYPIVDWTTSTVIDNHNNLCVDFLESC